MANCRCVITYTVSERLRQAKQARFARRTIELDELVTVHLGCGKIVQVSKRRPLAWLAQREIEIESPTFWIMTVGKPMSDDDYRRLREWLTEGMAEKLEAKLKAEGITSIPDVTTSIVIRAEDING